jgi:hypothetical protein
MSALPKLSDSSVVTAGSSISVVAIFKAQLAFLQRVWKPRHSGDLNDKVARL